MEISLFAFVICSVTIAAISASNVLYTFDSAGLTGNEIFLSQTIAGLYALQTQNPSIWISFKGWSMNEFWLNTIKQQDSTILFNNSYSNQGLKGLISLTNNLITSNKQFNIDGYIYADIKDQTFQYALSLAFHYNAVIATDVITSNALKSSPLNLNLLRNFSAESNNSYISIFNEFISLGGDINNFITFQDITKNQHLSDMPIATKSFIFWQNETNTSTIKYILQHLSSTNTSKRMLGWGPNEFGTVSISSSNTLSVVATDWANNMAQFYTIIPQTKINYKNVSAINNELKQTDPYHYVCFLWSDGDNMQWLMNGFFKDQWYGSDLKGQFPVSWTISGSVQQLAPVIYNKIIANATSNDSLVMAPSGWGYQYINDNEDIAAYSMQTVNSINQETKNIMNNVNFIDDWKNVSSYSKNVNTFLDSTNNTVKSILYYWYINYAGGNGTIFWSPNNIPIITAKLRFWEGINNYSQIATKLNNYPVDIQSQNGYSLISVHAWSESMQNISKCIQMLQPHIKVVGINDFVNLIVNNVVH